MKLKKLKRRSRPGPKTVKEASQKTHYRRILMVVSVLLAVVGLYVLVLILPTTVYSPPEIEQKSAKQTATVENRLHIPKLGLSITYASGGPEVLNEQAWHRFPDRGDPVRGGNFILSAHRFQLGFTPGATKRKSPFYHINRLSLGDKLYVDFEGKRYEYEVSEHFSVKPHQTDIESPSTEPKMTLYSCTFRGEKDGREVIRAKQVQSNLPLDGTL